MPKPKINYFIDIIMFFLFLGTVKSGLILFFFSNGRGRGGWKMFFGLSKHTWQNLHNWCGILLIFLVFIHLILHWKWIVGSTKNIFKGK